MAFSQMLLLENSTFNVQMSCNAEHLHCHLTSLYGTPLQLNSFNPYPLSSASSLILFYDSLITYLFLCCNVAAETAGIIQQAILASTPDESYACWGATEAPAHQQRMLSELQIHVAQCVSLSKCCHELHRPDVSGKTQSAMAGALQKPNTYSQGILKGKERDFRRSNPLPACRYARKA